MQGARLSTVLVAAITLAASAAPPGRADAQGVLRRIKQQTARRVEERKARLDSAVVRTVGAAVDSTVEKTGRGADAVVSKVGSTADTVVSRVEQGVASALARDGGGDDLGARLASGRLVLDGVDFAPGSDALAPSSAAVLDRLARAVAATADVYVIEGHVEAPAPPADAQALSERRAAAVKARLVAAGIPAARLVVVGHGATRPNGADPSRSARIEMARAQ